MNDTDQTAWILAIFSFVFMWGCTYIVGKFAVQVYLRLTKRANAAKYVKWGKYEEIFRPDPLPEFVLWAVFFAVFAVPLFVASLFSTVPLTDADRIGASGIFYTVAVAIHALLMGSTLEIARFKVIEAKLNDIVGLKAVFHKQFSISELIATYEALYLAPRMFWEEYAELPEEDVTEDTSRQYRDLAAPYMYGRSRQDSKTAILIAVLSLVLAVAVAVKERLL